MIKSKRLLAVGIAASLVLAACGGDDDDSAEEPADDTTAEEPAAEEPAAEEPAAEEPAAEEPATEEPAAEEPAGEMPDGSDVTVGLTYDLLGRGDQSFNDSAAAGADQAIADFGVTVNEITPTDASARGTDLQLQAENADLVIGVGFSFATDAKAIAPTIPDVNFAIVDDAMLNETFDGPAAENAAGLVFNEEQGSYLVGVAAALKSTTGKIGFIGGVSGIGLIEKFEAGYIAGAKSINPDIEVVSSYLSAFPEFAGFEDPASATDVATSMYDEGADIIYAAAGLSGSGMFAAAKTVSESTGTKVWGIGVDSDQFNTVDPEVQEYVLTSMLKRVDVAVYEIIKAHIEGTFTAGETRYDLAAGGLDYSKSGGFVDDIVPQLDEAKAAIIAGEIVVPLTPEEALAG